MWMLAPLLPTRKKCLVVEQILLKQRKYASEKMYQQSAITMPAVFTLHTKYWNCFFMLYFPSSSVDVDGIELIVLKHTTNIKKA